MFPRRHYTYARDLIAGASTTNTSNSNSGSAQADASAAAAAAAGGVSSRQSVRPTSTKPAAPPPVPPVLDADGLMDLYKAWQRQKAKDAQTRGTGTGGGGAADGKKKKKEDKASKPPTELFTRIAAVLRPRPLPSVPAACAALRPILPMPDTYTPEEVHASLVTDFVARYGKNFVNRGRNYAKGVVEQAWLTYSNNRGVLDCLTHAQISRAFQVRPLFSSLFCDPVCGRFQSRFSSPCPAPICPHLRTPHASSLLPFVFVFVRCPMSPTSRPSTPPWTLSASARSPPTPPPPTTHTRALPPSKPPSPPPTRTARGTANA